MGKVKNRSSDAKIGDVAALPHTPAAGEGSFDGDSDGWHVQNKITDARSFFMPETT